MIVIFAIEDIKIMEILKDNVLSDGVFKNKGDVKIIRNLNSKPYFTDSCKIPGSFTFTDTECIENVLDAIYGTDEDILLYLFSEKVREEDVLEIARKCGKKKICVKRVNYFNEYNAISLIGAVTASIQAKLEVYDAIISILNSEENMGKLWEGKEEVVRYTYQDITGRKEEVEVPISEMKAASLIDSNIEADFLDMLISIYNINLLKNIGME